MSRKATTRAANGNGTIRQRKDGTWEARFTVCIDPGSGKQVRRSVYGKTQKEAQALREAAALNRSGCRAQNKKIVVCGK